MKDVIGGMWFGAALGVILFQLWIWFGPEPEWKQEERFVRDYVARGGYERRAYTIWECSHGLHCEGFDPRYEPR